MNRATACAASFVLLCSSAYAENTWKYSSKKDQMNDTLTLSAAVISKNREQFRFPYQGGTAARITIRKKADDSVISFIQIERGQFSCHSECYLKVRFDEDEAGDWPTDDSADGATDIRFFVNGEQFAEKTAAAKRLRIQATFFHEGSRTYEFNVSGLKWPLEPPKTSKR
jgi:hypothetical protein